MTPATLGPSFGDVFATVPGLPSDKGVALNPPPATILSQATQMVRAAMAQVPDDERGSLVAIATRQGDAINVNLAFAVKVNNHTDVVTWIGKSWGEPVSAGVLGRVHF